MTKVLDSFALLAYLGKEPGYLIVQEALARAAQGHEKLLMSTVNWGEIYYILSRRHGKDKTEATLNLIETFPIQLIPADISLSREAAKIKAAHSLSYADCFAAALARRENCPVLTGDKEFRRLPPEYKIFWI